MRKIFIVARANTADTLPQEDDGFSGLCFKVYWICEILTGQMRNNAYTDYPNSLITIACTDMSVNMGAYSGET